MMARLPVKDKDHWFRDTDSGSVQCCDSSTYHKYMSAYKAEQKKQEKFDTLQNEVSELKSELSDIKSLLLTLVQSKTGLNYDD